MYRALTWWLMCQHVELSDPEAVLARLDEPKISVTTDPAGPQIWVDGRDVAGPIRTRQVSNPREYRGRFTLQVRDLLIGTARADLGCGGRARHRR